MIPNRPNPSIVVVEWINTVPELVRPGGIAATQLPRDNSSWGTSGFVVVKPSGGGRHNSYIPVGRPAVELHVYAVQPDTGRPLWHVANNIISSIVVATRREAEVKRILNLKVNGRDYGKALVNTCYPINSERQAYGDEGDYARLVLDMMFHWVLLEQGAP